MSSNSSADYERAPAMHTTVSYDAVVLLSGTEPLSSTHPTLERAQHWLLTECAGLARSRDYVDANCTAMLIDRTTNRTVRDWHGTTRQVAETLNQLTTQQNR